MTFACLSSKGQLDHEHSHNFTTSHRDRFTQQPTAVAKRVSLLSRPPPRLTCDQVPLEEGPVAAGLEVEVVQPLPEEALLEGRLSAGAGCGEDRAALASAAPAPSQPPARDGAGGACSGDPHLPPPDPAAPAGGGGTGAGVPPGSLPCRRRFGSASHVAEGWPVTCAEVTWAPGRQGAIRRHGDRSAAILGREATLALPAGRPRGSRGVRLRKPPAPPPRLSPSRRFLPTGPPPGRAGGRPLHMLRGRPSGALRGAARPPPEAPGPGRA